MRERDKQTDRERQIRRERQTDRQRETDTVAEWEIGKCVVIYVKLLFVYLLQKLETARKVLGDNLPIHKYINQKSTNEEMMKIRL